MKETLLPGACAVILIPLDHGNGCKFHTPANSNEKITTIHNRHLTRTHSGRQRPKKMTEHKLPTPSRGCVPCHSFVTKSVVGGGSYSSLLSAQRGDRVDGLEPPGADDR